MSNSSSADQFPIQEGTMSEDFMDSGEALAEQSFFTTDQLNEIHSGIDSASERMGKPEYGYDQVIGFLNNLDYLREHTSPLYAPEKYGEGKKVIGYVQSREDGSTVQVDEDLAKRVLPRELRENPVFEDLYSGIFTDESNQEKVKALKDVVQAQLDDISSAKSVSEKSVDTDARITELEKIVRGDDRFADIRSLIMREQSYLQDKKDAQRSGNGDGSIRFGQYAGQTRREYQSDPNYPEYVRLTDELNRLKSRL